MGQKLSKSVVRKAVYSSGFDVPFTACRSCFAGCVYHSCGYGGIQFPAPILCPNSFCGFCHLRFYCMAGQAQDAEHRSQAQGAGDSGASRLQRPIGSGPDEGHHIHHASKNPLFSCSRVGAAGYRSSRDLKQHLLSRAHNF